MRAPISSILLVLLLSACATAGPVEYGPATNGNFGYTDTQIEAGRFRVVYNGSGGVPADIVENQALRRAAEITKENGYDWFRIVNRTIDGEQRGGVSVGGGVGSGSVGRRSSVGVGVGGNFGTIGARDFITVRLEILLGNNPQPEDPDVYNANSVLSSISNSIPQ